MLSSVLAGLRRVYVMPSELDKARELRDLLLAIVQDGAIRQASFRLSIDQKIQAGHHQHAFDQHGEHALRDTFKEALADDCPPNHERDEGESRYDQLRFQYLRAAENG